MIDNMFSKTSNFVVCVIILAVSVALSSCSPLSPSTEPATLQPAATTLLPETPVLTSTNPPVLTPTSAPIPEASGYILYVSSQDGKMNLYMTTPDGVEQKRFTASSANDSTPRISPDGTKIAYVSTVDGNMDIYMLDIETLASTRLTSASQKDSAPSWSPDGSMIVFESFRDKNFEVYFTNAVGSTQTRLTTDPDFFQRQNRADDGGQTRLTDNPAGDHSPVWSPTRNEIAFESDRSGNSNIYLLDLEGNVMQLTDSPEADFAHTWSPDGNMLAYKILAGGDLSKICVIDRTGENQRCLTNAPSEYSTPVWSPDGKYLAASAKQPKGYGIDVFNVADGSVTYLYDPQVDPRGAPFWAPDGVRLVVQAKASDGNMDLFSVLIPTDEFTRLTNTAAYDGEPVWVTK